VHHTVYSINSPQRISKVMLKPCEFYEACKHISQRRREAHTHNAVNTNAFAKWN